MDDVGLTVLEFSEFEKIVPAPYYLTIHAAVTAAIANNERDAAAAKGGEGGETTGEVLGLSSLPGQGGAAEEGRVGGAPGSPAEDESDGAGEGEEGTNPALPRHHRRHLTSNTATPPPAKPSPFDGTEMVPVAPTLDPTDL